MSSSTAPGPDPGPDPGFPADPTLDLGPAPRGQGPACGLAEPLDATRPDPDPKVEARRLLTLCLVCKFCNGYCDVFRAAEERPALTDGDLAYLATLCHQCRNCWYACQYRPPHAFAVNLPRSLARLRPLVWRPLVGLPGTAWLETKGPGSGRPWRLPLVAGGVALLPVVLVLALVPAEMLWAPPRGMGGFFAVVPRPLMVGGALLAFGVPALLVGRAAWRFWHLTAAPAESAGGPGGAPRATTGVWATLRALPEALADILALRHLDGGGVGCAVRDGRLIRAKRWAHQAVVAGFGLTFAATVASALRHYVGHLPSPAPWQSWPVGLGGSGGLLMLAGAAGLIALRRGADPLPSAPETEVEDWVLLGQIIALAASGLALLLLRETAGMALLLALHLGAVLSFCVTAPLGKLLHAPLRALALLRAARERQARRAGRGGDGGNGGNGGDGEDGGRDPAPPADPSGPTGA